MGWACSIDGEMKFILKIWSDPFVLANLQIVMGHMWPAGYKLVTLLYFTLDTQYVST